MEGFLTKLLEMSLYGSIAILAVMIFRAVFRKVPKRVTCLFWLAAAFRLLCPVNFQSAMSVMNLFARKEDAQPVYHAAAEKVMPVFADQLIPASAATSGVAATGDMAVATAPAISLEMIAFAVWIGVMAVIAGYQLVKYLKVRRVLGKTFRREYLIESDRIDTPFVMGVFTPMIVMPDRIDKGEKEYLILHEKMHIMNHDNLTKAVGLAICCIHWFNPLVWIAYRALCNDLEMRVDEEVIELIGEDIKKDYCLSIVNHSFQGPRYKVLGSSFVDKTLSGVEVKMRINNLIKYKKIPSAVAALIVAATLGITTVLSACAATDIEKQAEETTTTSAAVETTESSAEDTSKETTAAAEEEEGFTPPVPDKKGVFFSFPEDFPESEYLKDYGEQKEFSYPEYYKILDKETVKADHYKGTDLYDLAKSYEESGYELGDYSTRYSLCGGTFFKEGFVVRDADVSDAVLYQVVKTDEETLKKYLFFNEKPNTGAFTVEIVSDKQTDDAIEFNFVINYDEDGTQLSFNGNATFYKDTNIAVIKGLIPAGGDENVSVEIKGLEVSLTEDGKINIIYHTVNSKDDED
ncbi:MAG: hypothetical protein J5715_08855 [Clostridiales bacterium]|nr:hypothetical protein [Clostridiales bacterium]